MSENLIGLVDTGNGVEILIPAPQHYLDAMGITAESALIKLAAGRPFQVTTRAAVPDDRCFREAWRVSGGGVAVDMPAAREIHMGKIRVARDKKLKKIDVDYIKADEDNNGALKAQIAAEKRRLRDLPQTFDLSGATTPEALKLLWPADLPKE